MADNKPPCLTVLGGPMAGNRFVLQDGVANILIGSDPVCAFHLPLPGVSAMHARLAVEPGGVSIWEAGSPRGLHVNDSRVEGSAVLRNGDIIWLGTPGEDDVVMLQVILPRLPSLVAAVAPLEEEAPEVEAETVALDPRTLSLDDPETPSPATAAPPESHELAEPMPLVVDSPLDAHFATVTTMHEPEEAGLVVDNEAESFVKMPSEPLVAAHGSEAGQDFVLADEGMPLIVQDEPTAFIPATPPPAAKPAAPVMAAPVIMPPGFEDETEERLVEAATVIRPPEPHHDPHEVDPNAYRAAYDVTIPPTPLAPPVAPARPVPPTPPAPAPKPAAAKPATPPARPARPATPPPARKPTGPAASQRVEPAEKPAGEAPPVKAKSSSSAGLLIGLGVGALVILAGGAFVVMKMLGGKTPTVAQATPPPVVPSAAPTPAPIAATPPPQVQPTQEAPTPAPVPTPTPLATPSGKPTPSPSPTKPGATPSPGKPGATPTPGAVATPAGPSPEQLKGQQVAAFLAQAEGAMGGRQYDQAVTFYDDALKLDPANAKATAGRAEATAARDAGRRKFVAGRTVVTTEKAAGGNISGFEGAAVQKAPDFLGRIEFEMSPSSGLKAGDPWNLKIFVVNEGKKPIRITDLSATAVVNGDRSGGAAGARAKDVAPQARVQVGEMAGAWKDATQSWSAEVLVTAKGDSLKNTLTWK